MDWISPNDFWKVLAFCGAAIIIGGIYLKRNKNEDKGRFSYQIIDNDEKTATVWFKGEGAERIHSTFITMDKDAALDCYHWTRQTNNSSILQPVGTAKHPRSEEWCVFYESFSPFSTWVALNDDQRLQSASNLLDAFGQMDRMKLALNPMENHGNYVVCRNEIRLINIRFERKRSKGNIEGLSEIFGLMLPTFRPVERWKFINYVRDAAYLEKTYNERLRMAIKYPYLRSSKVRASYCCDIYMRIINHLVPGPETFKLGPFKAFENWENEQKPQKIRLGYRTWKKQLTKSGLECRLPLPQHKLTKRTTTQTRYGDW